MKHVKSIIATILVATLLLTGITFDNTVTANAASNITDIVKEDKLTTTCEITIKPGDVRKITVHDKTGKDIQEKFRWKITKGEGTVINAEDDFVSNNDYTNCINVIALKEGTAAILGEKGSTAYSVGREFIEIKITVKMPKAKMTPKQKKCKHSWKTTKKATCERPGIKTCKKCKWQKSIAKKKHVFETKTVKTTEHEYIYYTIQCNDPDCGLLVKAKCDNEHNFLPDSKYQTRGEMFEALEELHRERREKLGLGDLTFAQWIYDEIYYGITYDECLFLAGGYSEYEEPAGKNVTTYKKQEICKYCGKFKNDVGKKY